MNFSRDIVVVGASTGGLSALKSLLRELPPDFPASVFIVQHTAPSGPGLLADILDPVCALPVAFPFDGEPIRGGRVYLAPPDRHLILEAGRVRLTRGPKENRFRPSVDVLFRSAAAVGGERVIGAILTGYLDDGVSGLYAIKERGGLAVVQAPDDAEAPDMPRHALARVAIDEVVPIEQMGKLLSLLVAESVFSGGTPVSPEEQKKIEIEVGIAKEDGALGLGVLSLGEPSLFACPECHGVLLRIEEGAGTRFRCHTGHAYSLDSLLSELTQSVEDSLWTSLRAVQETQLLLGHLAGHLRETGQAETLVLVERKLHEGQRREQLIRQTVMSDAVLSEDTLRRDANEA